MAVCIKQLVIENNYPVILSVIIDLYCLPIINFYYSLFKRQEKLP